MKDFTEKKELILKAKHYNWNCRMVGSWCDTTWELYNNHTVKIKIFYDGPNAHALRETLQISPDLFKLIMDKCDAMKDLETHNHGYDGSAWSFMLWQNEEVVFNKTPGYIYGNAEMEELASLLLQLEQEVLPPIIDSIKPFHKEINPKKLFHKVIDPIKRFHKEGQEEGTPDENNFFTPGSL